MAWYDEIDLADLGTALAEIAKGRGTGRLAEGNAQVAHGRLGLDAAALGLKAPGMRGAAAAQGDILAGAQDARVQGPIVRTRGQVPTITGGLRPSLFSGSTRQLGGQMSRDALVSQLKGAPFTPTPLPESSGLDTILNSGAGIGAILAAILGGRQTRGGTPGTNPSGGTSVGNLIDLFKKKPAPTPPFYPGTSGTGDYDPGPPAGTGDYDPGPSRPDVTTSWTWTDPMNGSDVTGAGAWDSADPASWAWTENMNAGSGAGGGPPPPERNPMDWPWDPWSDQNEW